MFRIERRSHGGLWEAYRCPESGTFNLYVSYSEAWDDAVLAYKDGEEVRIVDARGLTLADLCPSLTENQGAAHN